MKIIKTVTYEEAKQAFIENNPIKAETGFETNTWALNHAILGANIKSGGKWLYVELEPEEVSNIFLPWHEFDCDEANPLIPPNTPMNLTDTTDKIKSDSSYPTKNPECWRKIDYWIHQDADLILFLSVQPVPSIAEHNAYKNLDGQTGNLFHLDGFHRMISWVFKENKKSVYAFIAGSI